MRTDPRKPPLAHYIAAVNGDRLAGDVARFVTAEPQNGIGDLFRSAEALHGHKGLEHLVQLWPLAFGDHLVGHRRLDHTGADVIHADAASRVLKRGALGEADHAMLRGVIRSTLIAADQAAERRAVHDGAAALFAHNLKLELHAAPDTAQIDAHHTGCLVWYLRGSPLSSSEAFTEVVRSGAHASISFWLGIIKYEALWKESLRSLTHRETNNRSE